MIKCKKNLINAISRCLHDNPFFNISSYMVFKYCTTCEQNSLSEHIVKFVKSLDNKEYLYLFV